MQLHTLKTAVSLVGGGWWVVDGNRDFYFVCIYDQAGCFGATALPSLCHIHHGRVCLKFFFGGAPPLPAYPRQAFPMSVGHSALFIILLLSLIHI